MKINQFNSWYRISIIYLFILNISILAAAFLSDSDLLSLSAVLISMFQIFWYNYYRRKRSILPFYPFRAWAKDKLNCISLFPAWLMFRGFEQKGSLSRKQRSVVKKRAGATLSGIITCTLNHPSDPGFESVKPERYPVKVSCRNLRAKIGTEQCLQPYNLSVLNIGAAEPSCLSGATMIALSEGAKISGCAINTGGEGINQYLIRGGGDIIWQLAASDYKKDLQMERCAGRPYVKMLEVKLSSEDQAAIKKGRNAHKLLLMIKDLRTLSAGKPIGISINDPDMNILDYICGSIKLTGIYVDFFTVEGNEPLVRHRNGYMESYDNAILFRALTNARKALKKYNLTSSIIASGNIVTEFDILRVIALGADACYSIDPMVEATDSGSFLKKGDALKRRVGVANYHRNTVEATVKLMEFCSYEKLADVTARNFHRKINLVDDISLEEVYNKRNTRYSPVYITMN